MSKVPESITEDTSCSPLTSEQQFEKMTKTPVTKLIPALAVPTIASMMVTALYNTADTYFVSQISTSASGAVGVVFSLMAVIQAIGFMYGIGTGSNISRMLGQKDNQHANEIASSALGAAFMTSLLLCIFGVTFLRQMVTHLGATPTILPYAEAYAKYILYGAPFMCSSFVMNNILRSQGRAIVSMCGIATGGLLNIALDPLFIFVFKLGIAGAAMATVLSQFVSFLILFYCFHSGRSIVKLSFSAISRRWSVYSNIARTGFPSFLRQGLASFSTILLNTAAGAYGDAAVAGISIVTRIMMLMLAMMLGFGQGFQPVVGFSYGAGLYRRVRESFRFSLLVSVGILSVLTVVVFIFAPDLIALFRRSDPLVIAIGTRAMRFYCCAIPLQGFIIMTNMLLQCTGWTTEAAFVAAARQGIFFIPLIQLLPRLIGLLGVQITQPSSDILAFLTCLFFTVKFFRSIPQEND